MHLEALSNGLGAPSMLLFDYACERIIPATVSITADTGSEKDRILSTGERITARDFFDEFVSSRARRAGIEAVFYRAKDGEGREKPELWSHVKEVIKTGTVKKIHIPLFGSDGGRLAQSCTDHWKIRAIKQAGRALGAATMRTAQGLHAGELWRRTSGNFLGEIGGFDTYQSIERKAKTKVATSGGFDFEGGDSTPVVKEVIEIEARVIKWLTHYYPIGEGALKMSRKEIRAECDRRGVPYLVTSECDHCPHKDAARWFRTSPEVIDEIAYYESLMDGQYFFTDRRKPLKVVIEEWRREADRLGLDFETAEDLADFGCSNSVCGT